MKNENNGITITINGNKSNGTRGEGNVILLDNNMVLLMEQILHELQQINKTLNQKTNDPFTTYKQNIGNNLRTMRKIHGYTLQYVADICGVSQQSVSKWETGSTVLSPKRIEQLCDLYNCEPSDLISTQ